MPDKLERYRYLNIIMFLALAAFGFASLAVSQIYRESHPDISHYLQSLSEIILITGLFGIAYEYFLRGEIMRMNDISSDRVIQYLGVSESVRQLGLLQISKDANKHDFSSFLCNSEEVIIVLNDGRTWFSLHMPDMAKRLQQPGRRTQVLLIHPESPFLASLASKVGSDVDALKDKIRESVSMLVEHRHAEHQLEISGHFLPTTFSLFMNEHLAKIAPYPMAQKTERIPLFVFGNDAQGGYYSSLRADIGAVFSKHAKLLLHAQHPESSE